jgi:hypothetical protein
MHNAFSSKFSGFSVCHPIYDEGIMTQALQHAIYSAILNTEATATFMFLPAWNKNMISNPYSKLFNAYPHLCYELGTIPREKLSYSAPESYPNQEVPLPKHTWDLRIFAVWNTAARVHLNNHNKDWLQGLKGDLKEATEWKLESVSSQPVLNPMHAHMPGFNKLERLPFDKQHVSKQPSYSHMSIQGTDLVPSQSRKEKKNYAGSENTPHIN